MCLIHFYLTSTYVDLCRSEQDAEVWKNMPFRDGVKYTFVLDAVLALASLHTAIVDPAKCAKYTAACLQYQSRGISGYRRHLAAIDQDNCHALFSFAALLNALAIALACGNSHLPSTPSLEAISTTVKLTHGIKVVLNTTLETVMSAQYKVIFSVPSIASDLLLAEDIDYALRDLHHSATDPMHNHTLERLDTYVETINNLRNLFKQLGHVPDIGSIVAWPVSIGDQPVNLLKDGDAIMTLIFVHYGVLCLYIHDRWWSQGYGSQIIREFSDALHASNAAWKTSTEWARAKAADPRSLPGWH